MNNKKAFVSFLGLLLSMAIVVFIAYMVYKVYLGKPSVDAQTQKILSDQNVNTSSPRTILESTKAQIKGIEKQMQERESGLFDQAGGSQGR